MAFMAGKKWIFPAVHDLHIELVVIRGVALQSVLGDDGTGNLLMVGLNKYGGFHGVAKDVRGHFNEPKTIKEYVLICYFEELF